MVNGADRGDLEEDRISSLNERRLQIVIIS